MRRNRKRRNPFVGLTLSSFWTLVIGISMMRLFVNLFGDMMATAIPTISAILIIPAVTLLIGIVGWIAWAFAEHS
jgi:hypothetical protein